MKWNKEYDNGLTGAALLAGLVLLIVGLVLLESTVGFWLLIVGAVLLAGSLGFIGYQCCYPSEKDLALHDAERTPLTPHSERLNQIANDQAGLGQMLKQGDQERDKLQQSLANGRKERANQREDFQRLRDGASSLGRRLDALENT